MRDRDGGRMGERRSDERGGGKGERGSDEGGGQVGGSDWKPRARVVRPCAHARLRRLAIASPVMVDEKPPTATRHTRALTVQGSGS